MNCVELQSSLAEIEDGRSTEQQAHLKACAECSALVAELNLIASSASALRASSEPSPRVWNSIEIALREEGLIHPPQPKGSLLPSLRSRWGWARWAAPAAAALLIVAGLYVRQPVQVAERTVPPTAMMPVSSVEMVGLNDEDLLQEIGQATPALRAQYEDNLRRVNEYIRDAQSNVADNPNDDEARRSLMAAYQEKAMLFELAMDRSLP